MNFVTWLILMVSIALATGWISLMISCTIYAYFSEKEHCMTRIIGYKAVIYGYKHSISEKKSAEIMKKAAAHAEKTQGD